DDDPLVLDRPREKPQRAEATGEWLRPRVNAYRLRERLDPEEPIGHGLRGCRRLDRLARDDEPGGQIRLGGAPLLDAILQGLDESEVTLHDLAMAQVIGLVDRGVESVVELLGLAVDQVDRRKDLTPRRLQRGGVGPVKDEQLRIL